MHHVLQNIIFVYTFLAFVDGDHRSDLSLRQLLALFFYCIKQKLKGSSKAKYVKIGIKSISGIIDKLPSTCHKFIQKLESIRNGFSLQCTIPQLHQAKTTVRDIFKIELSTDCSLPHSETGTDKSTPTIIRSTNKRKRDEILDHPDGLSSSNGSPLLVVSSRTNPASHDSVADHGNSAVVGASPTSGDSITDHGNSAVVERRASGRRNRISKKMFFTETEVDTLVSTVFNVTFSKYTFTLIAH